MVRYIENNGCVRHMVLPTFPRRSLQVINDHYYFVIVPMHLYNDCSGRSNAMRSPQAGEDSRNRQLEVNNALDNLNVPLYDTHCRMIRDVSPINDA